MPSIKKICVLVIITIFCLSSAFAENGSEASGFSLSPLVGFLYGKADEIVYRDALLDYYVSHLIWDLKPLSYVGISAGFGPLSPFSKNGFTANLSLKAGLPFVTGKLEDWDWMNFDFDFPTHFSFHDTYSMGTVLADLSAGYSLRFNNYLSLSVYGEFSYMYLSWVAQNGYTQYPDIKLQASYPPWDDSLEKYYLNGRVIEYLQNWFILSPGISLKFRAVPVFSLEGAFNYTPLIYCADRDWHILRNVVFFDYLFFGHYFSGSGKLTIFPDKNVSFFLSASYRNISDSRGFTTIGSDIYTDTAGAGYSAYSFEISCRIRIPGKTGTR